MSEIPDYYLVLNEAIALEHPLACIVVDRLFYGNREGCFLVHLSPPLPWKESDGKLHLLGEVVLAGRYERRSLINIQEWPVYVNVMRLTKPREIGSKQLPYSSVEIVALGAVYASKDAAEAEAKNTYARDTRPFWRRDG